MSRSELSAALTGCPPGLVLHSVGLLSKWGFDDGDMPDRLMDYWDSHGITYDNIKWRDVLRKLVREWLVSALAQNHRIEVVDINTNHNPIRAFVVDGAQIDHSENNEISLIPESVEVPYSAIAQACGWGS